MSNLANSFAVEERALETPTKKETTVFNPLAALQDSTLFDLFRRMLAHRYRADILKEYYKLEKISGLFCWRGKKITPEQKAEHELKFLKSGLSGSLAERENLIQAFWDEYLPNDNDLREHIANENAYNGIAIKASDLKLVKPVFHLFRNYRVLNGGDLGCASQRLSYEIVKRLQNSSNAIGYLDWNPVGTQKITLAGADIRDIRDKAVIKQGKLKFREMKFPTAMPFEPNSMDFIITKWSLHHMKLEEMRIQISNIFRCLRSGGIAIVIEAFKTSRRSLPPEVDHEEIGEPSFKQRLLQISRCIDYADLWPEGPWNDQCYEITEEYLKLTEERQHAILALEDYFGHYILNKRNMPFPFSYLSAETLIKEFAKVGFREQRWNFLLFGAAPVIRRGPPTARFIFEKPGS